jgi:hypothetical protein
LVVQLYTMKAIYAADKCSEKAPVS